MGKGKPFNKLWYNQRFTFKNYIMSYSKINHEVLVSQGLKSVKLKTIKRNGAGIFLS
jgi:hypothetical protein